MHLHALCRTFADWAALAYRHFGSRVHLWGTFNEPTCAAFMGYIAGAHAPGKLGRMQQAGGPGVFTMMMHWCAFHSLITQRMPARGLCKHWCTCVVEDRVLQGAKNVAQSLSNNKGQENIDGQRYNSIGMCVNLILCAFLPMFPALLQARCCSTCCAATPARTMPLRQQTPRAQHAWDWYITTCSSCPRVSHAPVTPVACLPVLKCTKSKVLANGVEHLLRLHKG